MKRIVVLIGLALFAGTGVMAEAVPANAAKPAAKPSPAPRRITVNGVSIQAPVGWSVDTSEKYGVPLVLKHPNFGVNGMNVTLMVLKKTADMPPAKVKEKIYDMAEKRNLTVLEDDDNYQVGAFVNGYYALLENKVAGDRIKHAIFYAQFGNKFLVLTCTVKSDSYTQNYDVFKAIVASLKPAQPVK